MPPEEKLRLLPALVVAAENERSPVTYLVLTLRLCGLGGDRACRGLLDEMQREKLIAIERQELAGDAREKIVFLTQNGKEALQAYAEKLLVVLKK